MEIYMKPTQQLLRQFVGLSVSCLPHTLLSSSLLPDFHIVSITVLIFRSTLPVLSFSYIFLVSKLFRNGSIRAD